MPKSVIVFLLTLIFLFNVILFVSAYQDLAGPAAGVLAGPDLFRSTDGGDSWECWRYELTNPTQDSYILTIQAISPLLADSTYRLFISSGYAGSC